MPSSISSTVRAVCCLLILCLLAAAFLLNVFCERLQGEALEANVELPSIVPVLLSVAGFVVVAMILVIFNSLRFSNRVAGPMYRIQKILERVRQGEHDLRVRLRKDDFLVELAGSLNEFLAWLEKHPPQEVPEPTAALGDVDDAPAPGQPVPAEGAETAKTT